jgi:signal-transduction protein with cAMP-binding, CBS, and nucleotidyltransferase domain
VLDRGIADGLREAFEVINRIRFDHHAAQVQTGATADNMIDPDELAPIARAELREALAVVRRAQKRVGAWSPP